ncbi:DNA polymerase [Candidatus Pacearchaeota archaeon]|jgi:DNA polymerase-1|nr:DNA polymerase [Candidatus Pacearchaeota archaeon]
MVATPSKEALKLFQDGCLALAVLESNGICMDVERINRTIDEVGVQIEDLTGELKTDEVWKTWKRRWGDKSNLSSRSQLASILFKEMGYESKHATKTGRDKVDVDALEGIDLPFVQKWIRVEKHKKLRSTYLVGIRREVCDGLLHPSFNLHLTRTYRGSCDSPNFQNIPIRDPEIGGMIRRCFIPRPGRVLVEVDYSALEFRIASCFWSDPAMIRYASDSTLDIHRDMAAECYKMPVEQVTKKPRFYAKNGFVFPELYGSYYCNVARELWNAIESAELTTADGVDLFKHLRRAGISELGACDSHDKPVKGTFEHHICQVEKRFNEKFPTWSRKKDEWLKLYQKRGWFRTMTGFVCAGVFSRNELYNYPVQGPAFHCLLWSLIQLVKQIKKRKMQTLVVGQIHDSILADVPEEELDDYLQMVKQIMTVDVRDHWAWIVAPLGVEAEVTRTNWFEKKAVEIK